MLYNPNWVRTKNPDLRDLIYVLRHKETWPPGFEWDYRACTTCAMGLAHRIWPDKVTRSTSVAMSEAFGMNLDDAQDIFLKSDNMWNTIFNRGVSPEYIAKRLTRYLANNK